LCPARSTIGEAGEPEARRRERDRERERERERGGGGRQERRNDDEEETGRETGNLDKKIQHERGSCTLREVNLRRRVSISLGGRGRDQRRTSIEI